MPSARRPIDQCPLRVRLGRRWQREETRRDHPFGQIIDPLESAAPLARRDMAGIEQPFERALGRSPFPPARPALALGEVRRGERPILVDALEHGLGFCAALCGEYPLVAPSRLAAIGPRHPPAEQRVQLARNQRGFVRPIFEQAPLAPRTPGGGVEQRTVIGAHPRKGRQIVRPHQHIDAVDLVQPEAIDRAPQLALIDNCRARLAEALRPQRDAARLGKGDSLGQRRPIRLAAQA